MILLVIWLFVETQRAVNREKRSSGKVQHTLWRERCTYAIISFIFALSYLGRYGIDVRMACMESHHRTIFFTEIVVVSVYLIEGASMGVLMIFHFLNFDSGTLMVEPRSTITGDSIV